ncbi:MAG: hypothetical protein R3Y24_06830 [Eubacteriales bacterium]
MDKRDQLIEFIIQDIIVFITENRKVEFDTAMRMLYTSETFLKLQDRETGLYVESSSYVYELFREELEMGQFLQREL